ncbi:hypothetical protein C7M84_000846 [Penaeus vannamei]|uniref:Reverse transcriptase domain-containing protein n=1 Tax=Penaeus vannamei TaxID=6689 RepID=A0A3R7PXT1_PENVA|nr:hypothetical protein C7M84_000846 [Penaeus vannamei]
MFHLGSSHMLYDLLWKQSPGSEGARLFLSEWNAPIVLVKRKDKSHPRLCVDYRALNSQTKLEFYPLPLIEDILYQVSQSKWFSTLDLRSGYHQVPLDDDSIPKSAFTTP